MCSRPKIYLNLRADALCLLFSVCAFLLCGCGKAPSPVQPEAGSPEHALIGVWQSEEGESANHGNRIFRLRLAFGVKADGNSVLFGTYRSWLRLPKEGIGNQVTQFLASDFDDPTNPTSPAEFSRSDVVPEPLRNSMLVWQPTGLLADKPYLLTIDADDNNVAYITDPYRDITVRLVRRTAIGEPAHKPTNGFVGYATLEPDLNP